MTHRTIAFLFLMLLSSPAGAQSRDSAIVPPDRFDRAPQGNEEEPTSTVIDFTNPMALMSKGGLLMWPILFCSLLALTLVLERWIALRRSRIIPARFVRQLMSDLMEGRLRVDQAALRCQSNGSPAALVILAAVRHWGRPMSEIEQAINEGGQREIAPLKRNLRALNGTANLATLLGLLGTVIGMILAFNQVAVSAGQPKAEALGAGIAQALLTTAFGLTVAIPSLFAHSYFSGRVERLVYDLDRTALSFGEQISAEMLGMSVSPVRPHEPSTALPKVITDPSGRPSIAKLGLKQPPG